jgi:hypothetical protein
MINRRLLVVIAVQREERAPLPLERPAAVNMSAGLHVTR